MKKNAILNYLILFCIAFLTSNYSNAQQCEWANVGMESPDCQSNAIVTDGAGNTFITGYFKGPKLTLGSISLTNTTPYRNFFLAKYNAAGTISWAKNYGYGEGDAITVDNTGNIYVYGIMTVNPMVFGTTTLTNRGGDDKFLVKFDNSGTPIWATTQREKLIGSHSIFIATDKSGDVYVTGSFDSSITIGSIYIANNPTSENVYIAKYDSLGNTLWAKSSNGKGNNYSTGITVDNSGNSYMIGGYNGDTVSFSGIEMYNTHTNNNCMFLVKYDASGNVIWAKNENGNDNSFVDAMSVTTDPANNVYVTGAFDGTTQAFGTFTITNVLVGWNDIFLTKYSSSGNTIWAKSFGGNNNDEAVSVLSDKAGSIFVGGFSISSTCSFNTLTFSIPTFYLAKFNNNGIPIWVKGAENINNAATYAMSLSNSGNIFVTGNYSNPVTFGTTNLPAATGPYLNIFSQNTLI